MLRHLRRSIYFSSAAAVVLAMSPKPTDAQANDGYLAGIQRNACEAMLCLTSTNPPPECTAALNNYYTIKGRKWADTVRARDAFLRNCPMLQTDDVIQSIVTNPQLISTP